MFQIDTPAARFIARMRSVPHWCRYRFKDPKAAYPEAVALEYLAPGAKVPFAVIDYRTTPATVHELAEV